MASEARALAKKIAAAGTLDGPILQALMALDGLVATEGNRRALIEERFLPTLTALLQRKQEMVVSGAITLINSLSLHEDMQTPLASAGLGEAFARLLQSPQFNDVRVEALTTLANVLNNESIQRAFHQAGGLAPLAPLLTCADADVKGHAFRVATGVTQYHDDIQRELGAKGAAAAALASLLAATEDKEQRVRAARLLLNLAFVEENAQVLVRERAMPALLKLVQAPDRALRTALVKLLVNVANTEAPRRALLEASALQMCTALLGASDAEMQMQGAKLLTNLTLSGRVRKEVNEGPTLALLKRLADAPATTKEARDQLSNAMFNLKFPYVKLDEASLREVAEEMERVRTEELEESEEYTLEVKRSPRNTIASASAPHLLPTAPSSPATLSPPPPPAGRATLAASPPQEAAGAAPLTLAQRKALLAQGATATAAPPRASSTGVLAPTTAPAARPAAPSSPPAPVSSPSAAALSATSPSSASGSSPDGKGARREKKEKKAKKEKEKKKEHKKDKKARRTKKLSPDELVVSAPQNVRVEATEKPLELVVSAAPPAAQPPPSTPSASASAPLLSPSPRARAPSTPVPRTPRSKLAQQLQASSTKRKLNTKGPEAIEKRRANIAKELLYTENTYVRNIQYLFRKYYQPLALLAESKKPVLRAPELKALFSNLGAIIAVHTMLLESLAARITAWTPQTLLGVLLPMLKVYTEYVNNFDHSIALLAQLKRENSGFAAFLAKCKEEDTDNQHDIEGYLIQPVQRIPRYELLLTDLSRHTPEGHADNTPLKTAVAKIRETAAFIDEERGKFESLQKLSEIMRALGGKVEGLFAKGRSCVAEADVRLGEREGYAWLFNDAIIVAEKKGGLLRSATLQLRLFVPFTAALFGASGTVGMHVRSKDNKDECVFTFAVAEERDEWLRLANKSQVRP